MRWEFPKFPQDGKFPNLGNFPGIPIWEIPRREKFEAIREGGNGNFPLNIPAVLDATVPMGDHHCHTCSNKWPRTTGTTWGKPLASLAPELVADNLHVQMLPSVLHVVLATLTNAMLLPSFLE